MADADVKLDMRGLEAILKSLKGKMPQGRIGILGANEARRESTRTNAEIGAKHEFGDHEVPQRSFLRIPLTDNLQAFLEKSGAFKKGAIENMIKEVGMQGIVGKIVKVGEEVVLEAFHSGGFGKWPAHAPGYENNTGMILVDTQQLRNSITSEVK